MCQAINVEEELTRPLSFASGSTYYRRSIYIYIKQSLGGVSLLLGRTVLIAIEVERGASGCIAKAVAMLDKQPIWLVQHLTSGLDRGSGGGERQKQQWVLYRRQVLVLARRWGVPITH